MERKPAIGQRLYQQSRMDAGEYPEGTIINVMRDYECPDLSEVMVKFVNAATKGKSGKYHLIYNGDILWDARRKDFKVNTIEYIYVGEEEDFPETLEFKTFYVSDLEGNWSSSDGGMARWEIT